MASALSTHDAILLLRHSLVLPKLLYCLRTSPCFLSPLLQSYDDQLRLIVSAITNTYFGENDLAWTQASLPVKFGGTWYTVCCTACTFRLPGFHCCLCRSHPPPHPPTSPELLNFPLGGGQDAVVSKAWTLSA